MAIGFPEFFVLFCAQFLALTDVKKKKDNNSCTLLNSAYSVRAVGHNQFITDTVSTSDTLTVILKRGKGRFLGKSFETHNHFGIYVMQMQLRSLLPHWPFFLSTLCTWHNRCGFFGCPPEFPQKDSLGHRLLKTDIGMLTLRTY